MKRNVCKRTAMAAVLALATLTMVMSAHGAKDGGAKVSVIKGQKDRMVIDRENREIRVTATVMKDCSQPSVCDWGRRFQAFFGSKGGKMEPFFIFTTDVSRAEVDKGIKELGIKSRRQIPMSEVAQRTGLKATTQKDDYLDGEPIMAVIRWKKDGKVVERAIEDLIDEKIIVDGKEVVKPYAPHFVYHGTAEAISFASGCTLCPSDCNGGIIADNALPLKTTVNYYRFNWDKMPAPGTTVEVVLKSIYGSNRNALIK